MISCLKSVLYPANIHSCEHGILVLEDNLRTHQGVWGGVGKWVWFPHGETIEHSASDEAEIVGIFITDGAFEIHYNDEK